MHQKKSPPALSPAETDSYYAAAQAVVEAHRRLSAWLKVGVTLPRVDQFVADTLDELGCRSCFFKYRIRGLPPFPSHACLSLNDCVVHGTAGSHLKPLEPGDVLKVDIGVTRRGFIGDAAWTYGFREVTPETARLMESGKESLRRGVLELRPGKMMLDWARAVQRCVEGEYGYHLVRGLGGHGYGRKLHAPPYVSNVVPMTHDEWPDSTVRAAPGMLLAVEPMIAAGTHGGKGDVKSHAGSWPVYTADGSMSVHYEHDVLVTADGPRVLTEGMEGLPDIVG